MPNEIYQVSYWGYSEENGFGSIYHSYTNSSEPVETPSEPIALPSEPVPFPTPTPIETNEEPRPKKK